MTKPRMACPRCGRTVAANLTTRGPDGYRLAAAIRQPAPHRVELRNGALGEWCTRELHRGKPR